MGSRLHPRQLVVAGVIASLALTLGGAAVVARRADSSLASYDQRTRTLQEAWHARPFRREVLWGDAHDDNAFAHYDRAHVRATELRQKRRDTATFWAQRRLPATLAHDQLRADWRPLIEELAQGAHATDVRPVPAGTAHRHTSDLVNVRTLVQFAIDDAERRLDAGDARGTVERSLDVLTYGLDVVLRGALIDQMVGCTAIALATQTAWPDEQLARLDHDALGAFAAGLARLDAQLDPTVDGAGELATLTFAMVPLTHAEYTPSLQAWQYGFSNRWMFAEAFLATCDLVEGFAAERTRPWPQRRALMRAELDELAQRDNRMLRMIVPNYESAELTRRETVAHVRLLRMAVALRLGTPMAPLPDPLGNGTIAVATRADGTTLRCAEQERRTPERFVVR